MGDRLGQISARSVGHLRTEVESDVEICLRVVLAAMVRLLQRLQATALDESNDLH